MRIITIRTTLLISFFLVALFGKGQTTYNTVGVIGSATQNGGDASTAMQLVKSDNPHVEAYRKALTVKEWADTRSKLNALSK